MVGHSAACALAWVAADARPDKVARVALIGGFPNPDGETYFGFFQPVDGVVPFPGWEPFEGPDSDDMSDELKASVAAGAIAVPAAVTQGVVRLSDERRYDVPVTLVCPEFTPAQAKEWIEGGEVPELAKADPARLRRHRLGPLADVHQAGRAGPHPGRLRRGLRPATDQPEGLDNVQPFGCMFLA